MWIGIGVIIGIVALVALIGVYQFRPEPDMLMGEVDATEYRVSNKIPGNVDTFFVEEGTVVRAGDTLAYINSPTVEAKLMQAQAARSAASAQSTKAKNGARKQQIASAYEMWQKAETGVEITKKSADRVNQLYKKGVVSAQKRDEVDAQYKAAVATANAAKMQYEMAMEGAQDEDKAAAQALVAQASGAVTEVEGYMRDRYILAPADGEVVEIYPKHGELVGTGSPVMSIVDMDDMWFTFSVREDLLKELKVGTVVDVKIPALGDKTYKAKVTYMRAMASYATWRATKTNGQYDVKSFALKLVPQEPIADMRPGMTVIIVR
ncbi:MAG: efflux RND transporter periplasmic adaptor subunit [Bacteroidales bacterium]|nr:efflux RND transporter periplasmic adaptor subunit [Bacteroidales bacterium]